MKRFSLLVLFALLGVFAIAQEGHDPINNKFRQLGNELATPNVYRNAAGAPGHEYWQQQADYKISIVLDDDKQQIHGSETITYYNNSPDELSYLWVQLDQNVRKKENQNRTAFPNSIRNSLPFPKTYPVLPIYDNYMVSKEAAFDGGFNILEVKDVNNNDVAYTINETMMRIDLPEILKPGKQYSFSVKWWYNINNLIIDAGRSGMEYFEKDDNYVYGIAQFYPRMAVYSEVDGWQNRQFTGKTEFALTFGNYDVEITVPADHIVGATGVLQNSEEVLTTEQQELLKKAENETENPMIIVSEEHALKALKSKSKSTKTWHFEAENVRDFSFASSRRFIWDAMAVKFDDRTVMAMSLYPPEGNPLWEQYSTRAVAHTLDVYSRYTFDYPYPVAYSVHMSRMGMEYPMICYNGGRPNTDGTYGERTKYQMISVIIHEIGHNYFPMIVNSDEREWTWMDEGMNSFLQGLAEREWDHDYPSPMGRPRDIVPYMKGDNSTIAPIMINGELTYNFYANAYTKPATGLNILRETIMGRELFDFAFKQYAQRWMFKHPRPDDFFRTMEDASAVDLDWFWRAWFYGNDHVDISIESVDIYTLASGNPSDVKAFKKLEEKNIPEEIAVQKNRKEFQSVVEQDESMRDFYNSYDENAKSPNDKQTYKKYLSNLTSFEKGLLEEEKYYIQVDFKNIGGVIMPLIVQFNFTDGSSRIERIQAHIWAPNNFETSKVFVVEKELESILLDPYLETADCDTGNNNWPRKATENRFELYKRNFFQDRPNAMQE